jgi:hypothetical protein
MAALRRNPLDDLRVDQLEEPKETDMAAPQSDTNKGKSKFGLRPELVEAKERIYTEEKALNGTNAEAQEAARQIEEGEEERRQARVEAEAQDGETPQKLVKVDRGPIERPQKAPIRANEAAKK